MKLYDKIYQRESDREIEIEREKKKEKERVVVCWKVIIVSAIYLSEIKTDLEIER